MKMVLDRPCAGRAARSRIRRPASGKGSGGGTRSASGKSEGLNLRNRLSSSPEVYAGLQWQPYGE